MSRFIVLDHLLRSGEGHHLAYDVPLLHAAQRHCWQPVLAAHQAFADDPAAAERQALDPAWGLCPVFRTSDSDYRWFVKLHRARRKLEGFRQSAKPLAFIKRCEYGAKQAFYQALARRVKRAYGTALDEIWTRCAPRPGDLVFLPTATAIDLAGVADWARRHPAASEIDWHFNLHFPLVNLETWYGHSLRQYGKLLLWWPEFLAELAAALPADRVHWYTTSESMGLQLRHFLGRQFEILPYPVNPALSATRADDAWRVLTGRGRQPQVRPPAGLAISRQSSTAR